jgi:hypothetical protein
MYYEPLKISGIPFRKDSFSIYAPLSATEFADTLEALTIPPAVRHCAIRNEPNPKINEGNADSPHLFPARSCILAGASRALAFQCLGARQISR